MRNSMLDLNNHLFEMLEKLNDDSLNAEEMESAIKRSGAICEVAGKIIDGAALVFRAAEKQMEYGLTPKGGAFGALLGTADES